MLTQITRPILMTVPSKEPLRPVDEDQTDEPAATESETATARLPSDIDPLEWTRALRNILGKLDRLFDFPRRTSCHPPGNHARQG